MRAPLDSLTPREREVLALLRRGLTNEEIAARLGISLDGAKYHVSPILSKLGVATREEAAALAIGERRRWWARWPLWAKTAGAVSLAAAGALAILTYAASSGDIEERSSDENTNVTVEAGYAKIRESIARPGMVFHATLDREPANGDESNPQSPGPFDRDEFWIDGMNGTLRSQDRVGFRFIVAGDVTYRSGGFSQDSPSATWGAISSGNPAFCPGTTDAMLGFLLCGGLDIFRPPNAGQPARLDTQAEFGGVPAVALVFDEFQTATGGNGGQDSTPVKSSATPSCSLLAPVAPKWITRIYVNPDDFLPVALVNEYWSAGALCEKQVSKYQDEFLRAEDLPNDWFDPRSIGYRVENAGTH